MRFFKYLIVIVVAVLATLLCVWFFDCESCESCEGCDFGKVHISCESKGDGEENEPETENDDTDEFYAPYDADNLSVSVMSVKALSEDLSEDMEDAVAPVIASPAEAEGEAAELTEALEDEDYGEVPGWVQITFDVVVIAATVGVIILVWFLYKKFMKKNGGTARRFG